MPRSGYTEGDWGDNSVYLWCGAVNSAINGKRGQAFLKDLLAALDSKPEKTLAAYALKTEDGNYCALGVIGALRGIDMPKVTDEYGEPDPESTLYMAHELNIAPALAREIVYLNDEASYYSDTPEKRYQRVYQWVMGNIHAP